MRTTVVVNSPLACSSAIVQNFETWCHTLKTTGTGPSVYGIEEKPLRPVYKNNRFSVETWSHFSSPLKFHRGRFCFPLPVDWPWEEEADAQGRWMGKAVCLACCAKFEGKKATYRGWSCRGSELWLTQNTALPSEKRRLLRWSLLWFQRNLCGHVNIRATPFCGNLHTSVWKVLKQAHPCVSNKMHNRQGLYRKDSAKVLTLIIGVQHIISRVIVIAS